MNAERMAGSWAITVSGLPGVFSQAKRDDQVESMARDAIGLYLDTPRDSFDVVIREVPRLTSTKARRPSGPAAGP